MRKLYPWLLYETHLASWLVAYSNFSWHELVNGRCEYIINLNFHAKANSGEISFYDGTYKNGKYVIETLCGGRLYCHKALTSLDKMLIGQFFSQNYEGVLFAFIVGVETDGTLFCHILSTNYIAKVSIHVTFIDKAKFNFEFHHLQTRVGQTVVHNYSAISSADTLPNFVERVFVSVEY